MMRKLRKLSGIAALVTGVWGLPMAFAAPPRRAHPIASAVKQPSVVTFKAAAPSTWAAAPSGVPSFIHHIAAAGADVYVAAGDGLLASSDRGLNWSSVVSPKPDRLWMRAADDVYVATNKFPSAPSIARSSDHGKTWQATTLPLGAIVAELWGTGASDPFALGSLSERPVVLYSADAAKTLVVNSVGPKKGFLKAIGGTSASDVVIGGTDLEKPLLFRSVDKGKHWTNMPLPKATEAEHLESVNGICFTSSGTLFIATSYSVFATKDRGVHWKRVGGTDEKELLALTCQGTEVFAGGRGPTFLHSADDGITWTSDELEADFSADVSRETDAIAATSTGEVFVGGVARYSPAIGSLFRRSGKK